MVSRSVENAVVSRQFLTPPPSLNCAVVQALARGSVVERLRIVFDAFDVDGSGFLNAEQLQNLSDALSTDSRIGLHSGPSLPSFGRMSGTFAESHRHSTTLDGPSATSSFGGARMSVREDDLVRSESDRSVQSLPGYDPERDSSLSFSMLHHSLSFAAEVSRRSIGIARSRGNRASSRSIGSTSSNGSRSWRKHRRKIRSASETNQMIASLVAKAVDKEAGVGAEGRSQLSAQHSIGAQRLVKEMADEATLDSGEDGDEAGCLADGLQTMSPSSAHSSHMHSHLGHEQSAVVDTSGAQSDHGDAGTEFESLLLQFSEMPFMAPSQSAAESLSNRSLQNNNESTDGDNHRVSNGQPDAQPAPSLQKFAGASSPAVSALAHKIPRSHTSFSWHRAKSHWEVPRSHTGYSWYHVTPGRLGHIDEAADWVDAQQRRRRRSFDSDVTDDTVATSATAAVQRLTMPSSQQGGSVHMSLAERIRAMATRAETRSSKPREHGSVNVTINPHAVSFTVFCAAIGSDPYLLSLFDDTVQVTASKPRSQPNSRPSSERKPAPLPGSQTSNSQASTMRGIVASAGDLFGYGNSTNQSNAGDGSYFVIPPPSDDATGSGHTPVRPTPNRVPILASPADPLHDSRYRRDRLTESTEAVYGSARSRGPSERTPIPTGYSPPSSSDSLLSSGRDYGTTGQRGRARRREVKNMTSTKGTCCCSIQ
mgnify:FL=1